MTIRQNPVRVAHLTDVHSAVDVRIYHKECLTLADAGFQVALVAPTCDPAPDQVSFHPIARPKGRLTRMALGPLRVLIQALRVNAQIYHIHDPELIPIGLLLKFLGKRVIYDAHEDLPSQVMHKPYLGGLGRCLAKGGALTLCWATGLCFDGIIAAVPAIASRFPERKTWLVRNYPKSEDLAIKVNPTLPSERPMNGVYIGGISTVRGLYEMLEAAEVLGPRYGFRLVLAGVFHPESLLETAKVHPGWAHTEFVGWLDRAEVAKLLEDARCGLVALHSTPAFLESLPVKLFEYMATGTPVVASKFPLWEMELEDSVVFAEPENGESLVKAIEGLILNPKAADRLAIQARETALKRFSWATEAESLLACYHSVLEG